jgi:DNA-directed RNA polymerase specialized sigma24 family protein
MATLQHISDTELLERVLANDEKAVLYFFYEKYYSVFEYHVYKIYPYEVSVQGLVHEFFIHLAEQDWRRLRSFNSSVSQLNTWVSVVSFRFFLNYKKSKIDSNGFVTICEQWDDKILKYKQEAHEQVKMDVIKAIDELKNDTEREVVRQLLLDGMEIQDVASQHNLSIDYTYTVKSRALARLRQSLNAYRS